MRRSKNTMNWTEVQSYHLNQLCRVEGSLPTAHLYELGENLGGGAPAQMSLPVGYEDGSRPIYLTEVKAILTKTLRP